MSLLKENTIGGLLTEQDEILNRVKESQKNLENELKIKKSKNIMICYSEEIRKIYDNYQINHKLITSYELKYQDESCERINVYRTAPKYINFHHVYLKTQAAIMDMITEFEEDEEYRKPMKNKKTTDDYPTLIYIPKFNGTYTDWPCFK